MKKMAWLVGFALITLVAWRLWSDGGGGADGPSKTKRPPVAVRLAPVAQRALRDTRTFTGSLRAANTFLIAPKVWGRLKTVTVKLGDPVKNGQLVASLEDAEYRIQVEQAQAAVDVAEARIEQARMQLALAEKEYRRTTELREKDVSSLAALERSESAYRTLETELKVLTAQAEEKRAALRAAEIRLGDTVMRANWDEGDKTRFVGERFVDEGEMLAPNKPVLSIVEIDDLEAVVYVIERDYPLLRAGQTTTVHTDAYPGVPFQGTVVRMSQVLRESSRQAEVHVEVPNPERRLKPGMFVRVEVVLAKREDAVAVPASAVVRVQGKRGVWQVDAETSNARFVPVEVGIADGDYVEVLQPALTGSVVVLGHHLLREGGKVIVPAAPTETPTETPTGDGSGATSASPAGATGGAGR